MTSNPVLREFVSNGVILVLKTCVIAPFQAQVRCHTGVNHVRHETASRAGRCGERALRHSSRHGLLVRALHISTFQLLAKAVVTGVVPSPRFSPSFFIAHRVQQSHCSSIFHRVLPTRALALSASQLVQNKKVPTNLYRYARGGTRTRETDPYQARR